MSINDILNELRQDVHSNRDMGTRFEKFMVSYLMADPIYAVRFSEVVPWYDWELRGTEPDTGIDLVAKERYSGSDYCAIQCKFFDPDHAIQKSDIDSFFTASGKEPFRTRIIVTTTDKWSKNAEEALRNQTKPVVRLRLKDLQSSPVDWSKFSLKNPERLSLHEKKTPYKHQQAAIDQVVEGFQREDRGKLIMACGTGKTFTSLKIAEEMVPKNGKILFLVPSISLLSQTIREWSAESEDMLHSFAVCSDTKVGKSSEDISIHDLAFPATTNVDRLAKQVGSFSEIKGPVTIL